MTSSHPILNALIGRNAAVQNETKKLARYLVQRGMSNVAVLSANVAGVGTTTLTSIGLDVTSGVGYNGGYAVIGGHTYRFRIVGNCTVNGTAGLKLDVQDGTATFAWFAASGAAYTANSLANIVSNSAATPLINAAAAYTSIDIEGTFMASGSGSFGIRVAASAAGTAPILLAGTYLELVEIAQAA